MAALAPIAYNPHPGEHTQRALDLVEEVQARAEAARKAASATVAGD